jgi:hypothetical protein
VKRLFKGEAYRLGASGVLREVVERLAEVYKKYPSNERANFINLTDNIATMCNYQ